MANPLNLKILVCENQQEKILICENSGQQKRPSSESQIWLKYFISSFWKDSYIIAYSLTKHKLNFT